MFSILILTLNEERNMPRCLASTAGCDDVVVLDSGSTDRTIALAKESGARVFTRRFDNFAGQRNYGQKHIPFKHAWVFHLDADEQMSPELMAECGRQSLRSDLDGFMVAPKMIFMGRWIPHCTDFPAWQARFVRAPQFEFVEVGHGQREAPHMRLGRLRENYLHDLSSGGEAKWLEKHQRYARMEALAHFHHGTKIAWRDLAGRNPLRRRRALKHLSYSLPFRPALRFLYQYLLRGGFRDGKAGLRYCCLLARYERFASDELKKIRCANR